MSSFNMNGVKYQRMRRGLAQQKLAADLEIHPSKLSKIENGWMKPTKKEMDKLCKLFKVTPEELEEGYVIS